MLGKLIREIAKGAAEVVVSPLTALNETVSALEREVKRATEPDSKKRGSDG